MIKRTTLAFSIMATLALLLSLTHARAQEGILPGEPDPNSSPKKDRPQAKACPKGQQRFEKMKCGTPGEEKKLDCQNFAVVHECRKKAAPPLKCKEGEEPVTVYKCL